MDPRGIRDRFVVSHYKCVTCVPLGVEVGLEDVQGFYEFLESSVSNDPVEYNFPWGKPLVFYDSENLRQK